MKKTEQNILIRSHANRIFRLILKNADLLNLTERHKTIIKFLSEGKSYTEIGWELGLSGNTIAGNTNQLMRIINGRISKKFEKAERLGEIEKENIELKKKCNAQAKMLEQKGKKQVGAIVDINDIEIGLRLYNQLRAKGIKTLNEIDVNNLDSIRGWHNFGKKSYNELLLVLEEYGFMPEEYSKRQRLKKRALSKLTKEELNAFWESIKD